MTMHTMRVSWSVALMFLAAICTTLIGSATADRYPSAWANLPKPTRGGKHSRVWSKRGGSRGHNPVHGHNPFPAPRRCGKKICRGDGVCKWSGCGDCETCQWGKCVQKECPPCHSCDGWECKADCSADEHCVHDRRWGKHKCEAKPPPPQQCSDDVDCPSEYPSCEDGHCVGAHSCKGKPGKGLEDGACPAATCFNDPEIGQKILSQGSQGSDWVIGINQCLQAGKVSFITWAPAVDGQCISPPPDCANNKAKKVRHGATFVDDLIIPYGECFGQPICVYVHDGAYRKGAGGIPQPDIPDTCYKEEKNLCKMCGPYLVTPQLPASAPCEDPFTCTTGDTCGSEGECMGTPDSTACHDGYACTEDVCVAARDPEGLGVLEYDLRDDGSGCGHKATTVTDDACNDHIDCTEDFCGALPSVGKAIPDDAVDNEDGCFSKAKDSMCTEMPPACAVAQCTASELGSGCEVSERIGDNGERFCESKYGTCAGATCDVDGTAAGPHDGDGCVTLSETEANANCLDPVGEDVCGVSECDLTGNADPRASGDSPDGCVVRGGSDFSYQCTGGFSCETATCMADGQCKYTQDDALCNDETACTQDICVGSGNPTDYGLIKMDVRADGCAYKPDNAICMDPSKSGIGPFGKCVTPTCDPDNAVHSSGCVATAAQPSPCTVANDACGTSTCNLATGDCDTSSDLQAGQCQGLECPECVNGVCQEKSDPCPSDCTPACTGCHVCDTSTGTCVESTDTSTYDMVCYKCGNVINCAVKDVSSALSDAQLVAIQSTLADICSKGKTCQNQNCGQGATVYAAECFPYPGEPDTLDETCPCDEQTISNYAGYKVTVSERIGCDAVTVSCTGQTVVENGKCDAGDNCPIPMELQDQSCFVPPFGDDVCFPRSAQ